MREFTEPEKTLWFAITEALIKRHERDIETRSIQKAKELQGSPRPMQTNWDHIGFVHFAKTPSPEGELRTTVEMALDEYNKHFADQMHDYVRRAEDDRKAILDRINHALKTKLGLESVGPTEANVDMHIVRWEPGVYMTTYHDTRVPLRDVCNYGYPIAWLLALEDY